MNYCKKDIAVEIKYFKGKGHILAGEYPNGQLALQIFGNAGSGYDEPIAVITVAMPEAPDPGCIWVKDWSENEGMESWLVRSGLAVPTGKGLDNGFVQIWEHKLLFDPKTGADIQGDPITFDHWILMDKKTHRAIWRGERRKDFRGEEQVVMSGTPPRQPKSEGRVMLYPENNFYPSVVDAYWAHLAPGNSHLA